MSSVSEGMQRAHSQRQEWLATITARETTLAHVVELSKTEELKALSKLRILSIVEGVNGWTERSAVEALSHFGIGPKDTVVSIRRNKNKIEAVDKLIRSNPALWKPRPNFPEGWPFAGKLEYLYSEMPDAEIPDELLSLMEGDDQDEPDAAEETRSTGSDDDQINVFLLMGDDS